MVPQSIHHIASGMKTSTYLLVAANVVFWGYFVWSGFDGIRTIEAQHGAGYPNRGQLMFYLICPLVALAASLALPIVLRHTRWTSAVPIITLVLLLPFGCAYTGGV
jgi:hypothetical protein